ncbi:MAG: hypothetical protein AAFZ46_12245 [Pseudomonadota bacterium]
MTRPAKPYGWTTKETRDGSRAWLKFHGYRAVVQDADGDGSYWYVENPEGKEIAKGETYEADDFEKGKVAAWFALHAALPERFVE